MRRFAARLAALLLILAALAALAFAAPPSGVLAAAQAQTQPQDTVVVQPGDTLHWIAMRHGTTADALVAVNELGSPDVIYVGQRLQVPGTGGASAGASTASAGGGASAAPASDAPAASTSGDAMHTVRPGETLHRIALRYGRSEAEIAAVNGLASPDLIVTGTQLRIPGAEIPGALPATGIQAAPAGHVVRGGDTLFRLALRYGTTVSDFQLANGLTAPDHIQLGQELVLPIGARGDAPAPVADRPAPTEAPATEAAPVAEAPAAGSPSENAPVETVEADPAPPPSGGARRVLIDLSDQSLVALEGDTPVRWMIVSTGTALTPTPVGTYQVYSRYPSQHMYGPGYSLPGVPHVQYFTGAYAIHGAYWHANFGTPTSHGCVNLSLADAEWLYDWASYGTTVVVQP